MHFLNVYHYTKTSLSVAKMKYLSIKLLSPSIIDWQCVIVEVIIVIIVTVILRYETCKSYESWISLRNYNDYQYKNWYTFTLKLLIKQKL